MNCCRGRNRLAVLGRGVFVIASVLLMSCGGGGGGGSSTPTNADPTGYYSNTGKLSVNDGTVAPVNLTDMQGLIDGSTNHFTMLSANKQLAYDGTIAVNGNALTGNVTVYYQGTKVGTTTIPISGTVTSAGISNGVLSGSDPWGKGSFNLDYVAADNTQSDLGSVARVPDWLPTGNALNFTLAISSNLTNPNIGTGSTVISGIFSNCVMVGRIDPLGKTHLFIGTGITFTKCSTPANGSYNGYFATRKNTTSNDTLVVMLSNGSYSLNGEFQ